MSPRAACRLERLGFSEVYDYVPGKAAWLGMGLPADGSVSDSDRAGSVARHDVPTCGPEEPVGEVRARTQGWDTCVVVDGGVVLGVLDVEGLERVEARTTAEEAMRAGPSTFRPSITRRELAGWMDDQDGARRCLLTTLDGRLVGVVRREDL